MEEVKERSVFAVAGSRYVASFWGWRVDKERNKGNKEEERPRQRPSSFCLPTSGAKAAERYQQENWGIRDRNGGVGSGRSSLRKWIWIGAS